MLSYLMELQTFILLANCLKFTVQRFQLCVGFNTLYTFFKIMFPKYQLWIRWLQIIRQYTTYLVLAYITKLVIYSNKNHTSFTIGKLDYSVEMTPEGLVISLECAGICAWENNFLPQFLQLNTTLCHWNQNFTK